MILKIIELTGYNEIHYDWVRRAKLLAKSIEKHGLVHPIVVRRGKYNRTQKYRVIDGSLRVHAMIILGRTTIEAVLHD